jgi:RsiW-degrading membrane proteinase PrsW (M82 family)
MIPALALVFALAPTALILRYLIRNDAFPEPRRAIAITFAWGVGSIVPAVILALLLLLAIDTAVGDRVDDPWLRGLGISFFGAAIPEELFKFAVLYLYCRRLGDFDEPMDGIVYGVTASLGFATLENVLYVLDGGIAVAIVRALTAVPGHAMLGVVMGFYFGLAHFEPERRTLLLSAAYLAPVVLHGLYDTVLLAPEQGAADGWALLVFAVMALEVWYALRLHRRLRRDQQLYGATVRAL